MNGHFGVYIGNGWAIEARGTYYGVVKTRVKDRPWTYWFKSPWLEYVTGPSFKCDTTTDVKLAPGGHYQFKVTAESTPKVNAGTGGVSGKATGIYVNDVKQFVAHIK
jgi:hypothetical protein